MRALRLERGSRCGLSVLLWWVCFFLGFAVGLGDAGGRPAREKRALTMFELRGRGCAALSKGSNVQPSLSLRSNEMSVMSSSSFRGAGRFFSTPSLPVSFVRCTSPVLAARVFDSTIPFLSSPELRGVLCPRSVRPGVTNGSTRVDGESSLPISKK